MNHNLILLPDAQQDILDIALWYMDNVPSSIADSFLEAVDETLEKLKVSPEQHAYRHSDVRGIQVRRTAPKGQARKFPHIIFYRFDNPDIIVTQVFPMKSDPRNIRRS
ncbi:MAG: type II toxin-antitoxin system RelE/ParE family toxin [Bacteroidota bacterium]